MRSIVWFVGVGVLSSCVEKQCVEEQTRLPNVIFIYADDLGKGLLSAYGQKHYETPHIDSLITAGTSFSHAYGAMLSAPARASLLTGFHDCRVDKWRISAGAKYVHIRNYDSILNVAQDIDDEDVILPSTDLYLAQVFQKAGYITGQIGKLEYGFTATPKQMKMHGWDYYFGYLDHVRCHGFYPPYLFENGKQVFYEGNTRNDCGKSIEPESVKSYEERWNMIGKKTYSQDIFNEKIITFIRKNRDRPFFLYHPTQLPHGPVAVPEVDSVIAKSKILTPIEKEYATMVKLLDNQVGRILQELRHLGLEDNTIIIFSSDNGHEIYYAQAGRVEKPYRNLQKGTLFDDFNDKYYSKLSGDIFDGNAGMAGLKRSNLEGGVSVPLVFYWKGKIPAGVESQELVANYDFLPTFADWLNVTLETPKDGISYLANLLRGEKLDKDRYVVFGSNYGPAIVENTGWKLRYYKKEAIFELYNLREDPQERKNLMEEYPDKANELKEKLLKECGGNLENGVNRVG